MDSLTTSSVMEQCFYDRDMVYIDCVLLFHLSAVCGGNAARNVAIHWQRQEIKFKFPIRKDVISTQVRPQGYTQCVLVSNSEFKQSFCLF